MTRLVDVLYFETTCPGTMGTPNGISAAGASTKSSISNISLIHHSLYGYVQLFIADVTRITLYAMFSDLSISSEATTDVDLTLF